MISLFLKLVQPLFKKTETVQADAAETQRPRNLRQFGPTDETTLHDVTLTVTNISQHKSYGLLNKAVYFDFNVVSGSEDIKVGDQVIASASRPHKFAGFVATSVTLIHSNWDSNTVKRQADNDSVSPLSVEDFEPGDVEEVCGSVTELHDLFGMLDKKHNFFMCDSDPDIKTRFQPSNGDVIVGFLVLYKSVERVISWRPKTMKRVEGTITSYDRDWGVIDEDIIFLVKSCRCNFPLQCGLKLVADVIENNNNPLFLWRAFSLMQRTRDDNYLAKPNVQETEDLFIVGDSNFGEVNVGDAKSTHFTVKNNGENTVTVLNVHFRKSADQSPFVASFPNKQVLHPNSEVAVKISCKTTAVGHDRDVLIFEFDDFLLSIEVSINVVDPAQGILNPTAPYKRPIRNQRTGESMGSKVIIPGQKIFNPKANFTGYGPSYAIPRKLLDVDINTNISEVAPILLDDLCAENYCKKFGTLLHLEEVQMCHDMLPFSMEEVVLQKRGPFLVLNVPGLAEGRPSLLIGDKAMINPPNAASNLVYEGYIHEVHQSEIFLKFHEEFQRSYNGETFNVSFEFNRSNMKRLHQCIHHVYNSKRFLLFPKFSPRQRPLVKAFFYDDNKSSYHKGGRMDWNNKQLNPQQKIAVQRILEAQCRPLPYIIFGPPGTGKTVTLVEAVVQIYQTFQNAKILICTPSNSAADLFAERLLNCVFFTNKELVRLNSYQRNVDNIPDFIKPFCQDKNQIMNVVKFPLIISTCSTASILYTANLPANFFTHVFVDEACQLTEPESMIPIGIMCLHQNCSLIMAGDHKQLGPVLQSAHAKQHGLQVSYVERLMHHPLYAHDAAKFSKYNGYNPELVTMLTDCYRMHPDILRYPSTTFYDSQLRCCVPEERHQLLGNLDMLPRKGFPIVFLGVQGCEDREENSPSWFNSAEIVQVTNYLRKLYANGLKPEDIGIIAPYKKQVEKLRLFITAFNIDLCKIGSVEEFQGQERRVILISPVRSHESNIQNDIIHNIGFLSNPKRFNVAISRAKELLIVVGNPSVLSQDTHWKTFIRYCQVNGGYTGWAPDAIQSD